jgi:hypothetical protein
MLDNNQKNFSLTSFPSVTKSYFFLDEVPVLIIPPSQFGYIASRAWF